jgi:hypothetical protein
MSVCLSRSGSVGYCLLKTKFLYNRLPQVYCRAHTVLRLFDTLDQILHGKASSVGICNFTYRLLSRVPSGTLSVRRQVSVFRPEIIKYIILVSGLIFT